MDGCSQVPTVYPSWEEFKNFHRYIEKIEHEGYDKGGIVKVSVKIKHLIGILFLINGIEHLVAIHVVNSRQ